MYVKKKHSPLGIVSAVMCGISILFPTPGYSTILAVLAMLLAIIDLVRQVNRKRQTMRSMLNLISLL